MPHKHTEEAKPPVTKDETVEIAADDKVCDEKRSFDSPPTRPIKPLAEGEKHDHLAHRESQAEDRQEALLDEAIEETFPGSDPISPKHIT